MAVRLLLLAAAVTALAAEQVEGRVTDGRRPLPGVRVHPDRPVRVKPARPLPSALTDGDGRFRIQLDPGEDRLVLEKAGWQRDLVPRAEWGGELRLRPAPQFRCEQVAVVRLDLPGRPSTLADAELRAFLFSREPGVASAANYLYEVSKGSLLLEEGLLLHVPGPAAPESHGETAKQALAQAGLEALGAHPLGDLDRVDDRSGRLRPDGKADHLWVFLPGPPGSVTTDPKDLRPACLLLKPSWDRRRWPVVVLSDEAPLGNLVHEAFHAMGEHRVDDLYRDCGDPETAGIWDLMDAGQYRGWDAFHPKAGPWREDTGYSPSHPGPWVRTELWYCGRFAATVATRRLHGGRWTGWIAPIARAPGADPQRLVVPDPARKGAFWELWVSRPWGFEAGRVGGRFGPGHQGLLVARIDPSRARPGAASAPVRVLDAHPDSPLPTQPRLPCGRSELDDAAFALGPGEQAQGRDGALSLQVLEEDASGRMKVQITLRAKGPR